MKNYNSHITVDIKLLANSKNNLFDKIFKPKRKEYCNDFDYDVFCWLYTNDKISNISDLLFYNNTINESELVYLGGDEDIVLEDGSMSYPDAYIDIENIENRYDKIIFSLNLFNADILKINFQNGILNFNMVTNKKIIFDKQMIIESEATFYDFLELKKIQNSWVISDNITSEYSSLEEAIKNRLIDTN